MTCPVCQTLFRRFFWIKLDQTGLGFDSIRFDWIGPDWSGPDQTWTTLDCTGSDQLRLDSLSQSSVTWRALVEGERATMSVRLSRNDVSCVPDLFRRLYWIRLDQTGLDSIRLDSIGLDQTGVDQTRLDHIRLHWFGPAEIEFLQPKQRHMACSGRR